MKPFYAFICYQFMVYVFNPVRIRMELA